MKTIMMIIGLMCTTCLVTTGHAQFVDQIGSSDSFSNTGVGSSVMSNLSASGETTLGCMVNSTCSGNTAVGMQALTGLKGGAFNTATGAQALAGNTSGYFNTADGYQALSTNSTGNDNTATGIQALTFNTDSDNSAFGAFALFNHLTGSANTGVGYEALYYGTYGSNNTAVGSHALYGSEQGGPGSDNTAVGTSALESFSEGSYNAAVGESALQNLSTGENNTAFGYQALYHTTTGFGNAAQGASALRANTTGYHNTGIGNAALGANQTGNNNTALGYDAGSAITGSNNIDIGNNGVASESGVIRIGTTSLQSSIYVQGIYNTSGLTGALPVVVTSAGKLGVGGSSSEHLKSEVAGMGDRTERLQELRPVTFQYKNDAQGTLQYGLIAEEVAKVYPELVVRDGSGRIYGVRYDELAPMLLNEVQKQAAEIREMHAALVKLQAENALNSRRH